ncbi:chemotaxis protein CheA [Halalkalibacterium halodurans]|uniref:chemotaxis protein CheA n=1 Tax=Halalkalibacterium halodurans TaxID=86665 RepID=UPI002AA9E7AA|nr:chemotaxis protein CheA [Halalkalibacterium halodurans]MDY7223517.1 chemotaxis protein CheA [Halalkalibacterium halodurans]MDY7242738.1 chemotaxis protein CheA [Halalkalibacterium halodurans]MED3646538.1 chemotaxis protein CheA [Halalkalibacterium halodurans]
MSHSEYLEVFIDESQEHLQAINDNLLKLEVSPSDLSIVGEIFRSAHTLKGMAATMGFEDLAHLTHNMENVLDLIRNQKLDATSEVLDVVFEAVDDLEAMVGDIASGGDGKRDVTKVVVMLEQIEKGETPDAGKAVHTPSPAAGQLELSGSSIIESYDEFEMTVLDQSFEQGYQAYQIEVTLDEKTLLKAARVFMVFEVLEQVGEVIKSTPSAEELEEEKFDERFLVTLLTKVDGEEVRQRILKVSEITAVDIRSLDKQALQALKETQHTQSDKQVDVEKAEEQTEKKTATTTPSDKKGVEVNKTVRVNIERLDVLMNLFEELVIDRGRLEQIASELNQNELNETVERMSRISGDLQEIILNMRMMPVEQVFNRFPRMVRSLSKELNKKVNLEIVGAETELDRTIIDEIGDPLVHLIRNSIDHGIETPEVRRAAGKPEEGTVILRAFHSGNNVFIEIEDDGAGIDRDKVLQKALTNGVVTEEDAAKMNDSQVFQLLFAPGFSTAEKITDISGRGVGLDVVQSTFESIGGVVSVTSKLGKGSLFSIQLPLTLSIIDVMLVEVADEKYAIPLSSIVETAIVNKNEVYSAHNQKVIDFRGKVVPLVFLSDIFAVPEKREADELYSLVIVHKGEKVAGLVVDSLIGQHDIVLKSLGDYLTDVFAISGATILGNGQVALIVDTNALIK